MYQECVPPSVSKALVGTVVVHGPSYKMKSEGSS